MKKVEFCLPKDFAYYPSRIMEARHSRGFSRRRLEKVLKLRSGGMEEIEAGYISLTENKMMEFAALTELPWAFFTDPPKAIKPGSIGPAFFCTPSADLEGIV